MGVVSSSNEIFKAIHENNIDKLKELVNDENINVRMQESGLQTPLMASVLGGNVFAVKTLLEMGADTTIPEKDGYTPMHGAGFQGRAEIAKILMDHELVNDDNINVRMQESGLQTPLM